MSDKVNTGHNIEDKKLIKNARKPVGELGHQILDRMNKSHESMARWGVSHFQISEDDVILDIGCGGGRNLERFAEQITTGKVWGIDYSEVSVEKSINLNKEIQDEIDKLIQELNKRMAETPKFDLNESCSSISTNA